jgi:hypothetical protein
MMEPIEVTARFDLQGRAHPLKFVLYGAQIQVASSGRIWEDAAGRHVLVMDPQAQVYELIFAPQETRWYLNTTASAGKKVLPT